MAATFFHSLLLAQIMGLYFLILAIIMLLRRDTYQKFVANLKPGSGVIMLAASFALIIGLLIVIIHNRWLFGADVIITILGWLIVIKSILWLAIPDEMLKFTRGLYRSSGYYVFVALLAVIGIFLIMKGFHPYYL